MRKSLPCILALFLHPYKSSSCYPYPTLSHPCSLTTSPLFLPPFCSHLLVFPQKSRNIIIQTCLTTSLKIPPSSCPPSMWKHIIRCINPCMILFPCAVQLLLPKNMSGIGYIVQGSCSWRWGAHQGSSSGSIGPGLAFTQPQEAICSRHRSRTR